MNVKFEEVEIKQTAELQRRWILQLAGLRLKVSHVFRLLIPMSQVADYDISNTKSNYTGLAALKK